MKLSPGGMIWNYSKFLEEKIRGDFMQKINIKVKKLEKLSW